ncbi:hypothetical protein EKK58_10450 [Candidatus Dependentiae bacterium]|nr:MAG: hypothetical protein EKK58_10450 [Candidatus Dependentiae bacterium]
MSDNKPIVIEEGILKESTTSGGPSTTITSSDPALTVSNPAPNTYVLGFDAELSKIPNMKETFVAGMVISAMKLVYCDITGNVFVADNEDVFDKALVVGMALNAASTGNNVEVLIFGIYENPSWSWTANDLLFLNTNGNITSVPPVVGYQTTIGKALSSTSILINIKDPIEL